MHNVRDEKILIQFGKNLKRLRNEAGITQEELSYRSELALSQIARIETGKINTTICTVYTIAKALEVNAGKLFIENLVKS
ncbi:MAG: helix-turn-helix transcriptional regulator [Flavobacteriales bacterium]|nr:helix-turn-helix transcriptional regulator [Flavobacteriales bacterium]